MKKMFVLLSLAVLLGITGCSVKDSPASSGNTVSKEDYDKVKADLDAANSKTKELESEIKDLKEKLSKSETESAENNPSAGADKDTAKAPANEDLTAKELEAKLKKQPMFVVSTDYMVQSDEYKALYPDMLNAIFKNTSGKEIKNVKIAYAAWDKNNLPVKIVGQFDFDGGNYIAQVNYDDVNMLDGATYGNDSGFSLSENCKNVKTVKAIVSEYTDFDGNTWQNPYYKNWVSVYENQKLKK